MIVIISAIGNLVSIFVKLLPFLKDWVASKRQPYFTQKDIKDATEYYVKPYCQPVDPTIEDVPDRTRVDLFETINYLLSKPEQHKYVLLLGGTGTGKSAFLLNYFAEYQSLFRWNRYRMLILPLGFVKDAKQVIENTRFKKQTVLCLDALDEDAETHESAEENKYQERIWELCSLTREFRSVIITCRSQFFPQDVVATLTTKVNKGGAVRLGESGEHEFSKHYMSYFDERQIRAFLNKRFPEDHALLREGAEKAKELVERIPELTMRPMILGYVDDLINKPISYKFQIYDAIVAAWIEREKFWDKQALKKLTEELAIYIYSRSVDKNKVASISSGELLQFENGEKVKQWKIEGRSLLVHDASGNYKFAHRSIMEYLFVKRFMELPADERPEVYWSNEMNNFLLEMIEFHSSNGNLAKYIFSKVDLEKIRQLKAKEIIPLRSEPQLIHHTSKLKETLERLNFFDRSYNPGGKVGKHLFFPRDHSGAKVIVDLATCLMWQESGSSDLLIWKGCQLYIKNLNKEKFAGYDDWRLPTLEEAMSLMEREKKNGYLYIDQVFDRKQRWIWTADCYNESRLWGVNFAEGSCENHGNEYDGSYARAVRS